MTPGETSELVKTKQTQRKGREEYLSFTRAVGLQQALLPCEETNNSSNKMISESSKREVNKVYRVQLMMKQQVAAFALNNVKPGN